MAAAIALLIFLASYEIAREAVLSKARETVVTPWILGGVVLSLLIPFVFSFFEMRAGRRANSPSLVADAKEYRIHVLTSGMVFCALIAHTIHQPVDKIAALLIVVVVAKTGWNLLSDSMRVLLDASLDPETLLEARHIIEREPTVVRIHSLMGRNAGRYRFLEAEVEVKVRELERADLVARKLERDLREQIPHVERVIVDVRPLRSESLRLGTACRETGWASQRALRHILIVLAGRQAPDRRSNGPSEYGHEPLLRRRKGSRHQGGPLARYSKR